ncbi:MAG TPA: ABC transporter ATP-binding protein [Chitinophagaceae bacterium]|nr:ABC transporter ATP-binding protein [Chitinophagaceae bacterium]
MKQRHLKHIFVFLRPYWLYEVLLFALLIIITLSGLASPYFLKIIIDEVLPSGDFSLLMWLLLALTGIYILRALVGLASDYLNTWLGGKIIFDIKTKLFNNLLHLPLQYFESNNPGDTIQRVNNEVDKIQYFLTTSIIRLLNNSLSVIGLVIMLCILDYTLFIASVVFLPLSIIANRRLSGKIRRNIESIGKQEGDNYNFYFDRIRNIKLIKTFNAYTAELLDIQGKLQNLFGLQKKNTLLTSTSRNISLFLVSLGPVVVLAYGGYHVMEKTLTIGAMVAFIQYLNRLYGPANDLLGLYVDYVKAVESVKRITPVLTDKHYQEFEKSDRSKSAGPVHSIELCNVSYNNGGQSLVRHVNLRLEKGRKYALVGPTGCGKSTLIKILCGLYEPHSGSVMINDTMRLKDMNKHYWMKHVAVITQDICILYDSIRKNLQYGNAAATDQQLWESLSLVNLSAHVKKMPQGLESKIGNGEQSILPSGGQMQQLALARVFLKDAAFIILDETTSSLDSENERHIMETISRQFADRIVLVASHRLSTIVDFDEIIYMESGNIAESGTHETLAASRKGYYSLFRNQLIASKQYAPA